MGFRLHRAGFDRSTVISLEECFSGSSTREHFSIAILRSRDREIDVSARRRIERHCALSPIYITPPIVLFPPHQAVCATATIGQKSSSVIIMRHLLASRFVNDLDPHDSAEKFFKTVSRQNFFSIKDRYL